jgi:hypothetical protein
MRLRLPQRRARVLDAGELEDLTPLERACARFNSSGAARIVAGLVRSLGQPRVSVGARAGHRGEMRVTVAWELAWYQWAVDVGPEGRPVHELAKGGDVAELDAAARQWNAHLADGEGIVVG